MKFLKIHNKFDNQNQHHHKKLKNFHLTGIYKMNLNKNIQIVTYIIVFLTVYYLLNN